MRIATIRHCDVGGRRDPVTEARPVKISLDLRHLPAYILAILIALFLVQILGEAFLGVTYLAVLD